MAKSDRPNILYIMSDDHAAHAISAYGSRINETPNIDRIANEGMRLDNCFCTNSICTPSRATILTGLYSHKNDVRTLSDKFDSSREHVARMLQRAGYQTAIIGKWHLGHGEGHDPTGFDYWSVVPGQGLYHSPVFIEMGRRKTIPGYATDIITDLSLEWLKQRDPDRPFLLMVHHKAPHRPWQPDAKHAHLYERNSRPPTFYDGTQQPYRSHCRRRDAHRRDMTFTDLKEDPRRSDAPRAQAVEHSVISRTTCAVASIDDNVGTYRLFSARALPKTPWSFTSDQGFFLGDRLVTSFFHEESLRAVSHPLSKEMRRARAASNHHQPRLCLCSSAAGLPAPAGCRAAVSVDFAGKYSGRLKQSMCYRYYMHGSRKRLRPLRSADPSLQAHLLLQGRSGPAGVGTVRSGKGSVRDAQRGE